MSEDNAEYNTDYDEYSDDTYPCGCCMCCGCDCWDNVVEEDKAEEEDELSLDSLDDLELPDIDMTTYDQADNANNDCTGGGCAI